MSVRKVLNILAISLALSGYSAWFLAVRERKPAALETQQSVPATEIPLLRTDQAEALWHDPGTLFVDVRSPVDYGFGHIAGAVNLPAEELERYFPDLKLRLERARAVVVYCKSRDCGKSLWSAIRLRQKGLTRTYIYPEGWNEWFHRGLPTAGR